MTMKRLLHCTLIFMTLVTAGCDRFSGSDVSLNQNINSQPSPQAEKNKVDFKGAAQDLDAAALKLKSPGNADVKSLKTDLNKAIQKLGKDADDLTQRCVACSDTTKSEAVGVWESLKHKSDTLVKDSQKLTELAEDVRSNLRSDLITQADKLRELSNADPVRPGTAMPAASPIANNLPKNDAWWSSKSMLALQIVGVLLALVLFAGIVNFVWKRSWRTLESNLGQSVKAHVAATREAQPDYAPRLLSIASTQAEMSSRLSELDTEVRSLARLIRESFGSRRADRSPSYGDVNYQSHLKEVKKDEPEFPVSAFDYLGKMDRFANVVRPDFQNGILVNDPDGTGELVLIRDPQLRDDNQPLFVVPRATQFHTKQDFYTYYQKYYDCTRPSAGDVWIIGPAVVEKVTGGWQLREKGMLEIR